jgi:transcription-repair coupling factor (superfamily II helicase)
MIDLIREILEGNPAFDRFASVCAENRPGAVVTVSGLAGSLAAVALSGLYRQRPRQILVVARDQESAGELNDDIGLCLGEESVHAFGGDEQGAMRTLRSLARGDDAVVVTSPPGLLAALPAPAAVDANAITVEAGGTYAFSAIQEALERFGFERKEFVEASGDFAVRGGILDVYPFIGENPVRLEFFGETVESVREFDPLSQRSIRDLSIAVIVPDLLSRSNVSGESADSSSSLLDFLSPGALVFLDEPEILRGSFEEAAGKIAGTSRQFSDIEGLLELFPVVQIRSASRPDSTLDFAASPQPSFNSSVKLLHRSLLELQQRSVRLIVACDSPSELARLKDLLASADGQIQEDRTESADPPLDLARMVFAQHALHQGFVFPGAGLAYYTEHQIFSRLKRRGRRRPARFKGFTENELQQLRKGDFVVHQDFGIGRYAGLSRIRVKQVEQEVVKVEYAEKDTLYVNLNYVNRLQKYSSKEGHIPKLTRLGSSEWDRLKARAKKRVKDIARDLIQLYATRKKSEGHSFLADTPWQKELEASFMYEDTFDQAKATIEVKRDMEAPYPMDRLVCGDVGFGKTEVAVRAAFKAVVGGKQAAVLVPTTILAMQHFNTFVDRTSRYGVGVQVISRFKTKKEQAEILAMLQAGSVDIVIGTHRLLSRDVRFKDLGLLIIDEEHRFGVTAKEKLRQLRTEVDTLALTATPIPRTLHFSLMGARDLSIIATPPRNRLPVITEITQWNDDLIRESVHRELHRGGQVYVVHDRIQNIDEVTSRLREILPGVRITLAHGQMHAHELEAVMMSFLEKKVDVLVSTKIIESGLDIPNVNTILINRADRFGMAELYQLRGRVGRSNVQAYAYLLTPPFSVLPTVTIRRLQALQEFNELGSGFNLAMRDLEIRGAGNLLGSEQSGFIESMGFETYTRILEDAVRELKDEEFREVFAGIEAGKGTVRDMVVEPEFDALIPESYVPGEAERLAIYRRLYALTTPSQLQEVADELRDRFGKFPEEVENLLGVIRLRLQAAKLGFRKVNISESAMDVEFPPETEVHFYEGEPFQQMMTVISGLKGKGAFLKQHGSTLKLHVQFGKSTAGDGPLKMGLDLLHRLVPIP